ncbi:MAG: DctP family TRAP transporter solute-binding subunit [Deltaproteobacteria bacterium]|nr:DctP family TRAP transporter solute-binding subunit [Deltaproteobacteria bacterium]MBW2072147.1 DctP family TRAP transporter solute-binding subunit [Deltaproteobacteria bacterium]
MANNRFKTIQLGAVLVVALAVIFGVSSQSTAGNYKKEYKLTLNVPSSFYWGMGATKFAELVKEKTKGQINIKPYYSSALLKGAQLKAAQMVAKGVIDCAYESTINISPVIPEANIFHLPFFINTFENLDKMEYGQTGKLVFAALEKKGLKGLAWAENGFRQVTNSKRPILVPGDLKGLRIRVVGSPIFIDTFRQLGADPVNMNWGDAVTAFQQGVVDGQENPVGVLIPVQIFQYHHYATFWNYLVDPLIIYWNKKEWDSFPRDIQQAILEAAAESAEFEKALCRAGLDGQKSLGILQKTFHYSMKVPEPVKFLESKGMKVSFLDEQQRQLFIAATRPIYDKWVPRIGKNLYEAAKLDMSR